MISIFCLIFLQLAKLAQENNLDLCQKSFYKLKTKKISGKCPKLTNFANVKGILIKIDENCFSDIKKVNSTCNIECQGDYVTMGKIECVAFNKDAIWDFSSVKCSSVCKTTPFVLNANKNSLKKCTNIPNNRYCEVKCDEKVFIGTFPLCRKGKWVNNKGFCGNRKIFTSEIFLFEFFNCLFVFSCVLTGVVSIVLVAVCKKSDNKHPLLSTRLDFILENESYQHEIFVVE
ncbi:hypothetical protein MHBO_002653 [Bonamia ostreae]|uniref:Uncharacterized protein n=1 Tax=Bonamia ostreae TaxID=126728 RepID=A0ABV2AN10_9EUKA